MTGNYSVSDVFFYERGIISGFAGRSHCNINFNLGPSRISSLHTCVAGMSRKSGFTDSHLLGISMSEVHPCDDFLNLLLAFTELGRFYIQGFP